MKLTPLERVLLKALTDAQAHLQFCSWGDAYERSIARGEKLPQKIDAAIAAAQAKEKEA